MRDDTHHNNDTSDSPFNAFVPLRNKDDARQEDSAEARTAARLRRAASAPDHSKAPGHTPAHSPAPAHPAPKAKHDPAPRPSRVRPVSITHRKPQEKPQEKQLERSPEKPKARTRRSAPLKNVSDLRGEAKPRSTPSPKHHPITHTDLDTLADDTHFRSPLTTPAAHRPAASDITRGAASPRRSPARTPHTPTTRPTPDIITHAHSTPALHPSHDTRPRNDPRADPQSYPLAHSHTHPEPQWHTVDPADTAYPEEQPPRWLVRTLQILAYGIPLAFLAYVLYINYLPFGYEKTFTIDVGAEGDTNSRNAFYLQPSPDLSERKVAEDGTTYRELGGIAYAVFKPPVVLKDAQITVSVEGEGVSIIPPVIDFNPDDHEWDYEWDFTNPDTAFTAKTSERARAEWQDCSEDPITGEEVCEQIPVPDLVGNAFFFDDALTFNGRDTRLELANSADKFEDGPFTVYVEWTPTEGEKNFQQIVGHFNWEILQNSDSVVFQVGRMNDETGKTYSARYQITDLDNFFHNKHSLIAIYSPTESFDTSSGYISIIVDNQFVENQSIFTDTIWKEYGNSNLSLGWAQNHLYGNAPFLNGSIHKVQIIHADLTAKLFNDIRTANIMRLSGTSFRFPVYGEDGTLLEKIYVRQY